jgi:Trypsin-like peptidase domain
MARLSEDLPDDGGWPPPARSSSISTPASTDVGSGSASTPAGPAVTPGPFDFETQAVPALEPEASPSPPLAPNAVPADAADAAAPAASSAPAPPEAPAAPGVESAPPADPAGSDQAPPDPETAPPAPAPRPEKSSTFRRRILPRSFLGVGVMILAFAVGAGFSGVVLYSYYQYKLNQTNARVNTLVTGYKQQFAKAESDLQASVAAAQANIQEQLKSVQQLQASPAALATLVAQVAPSVFFVHTLDTSGQPSVGTAFVISSNPTESLLVTSYTTVSAATHTPGPPVYVRQGNSDTAVTVRTWDPQYDLALLILPKGNLKALTAAPTSPAPLPGQRLYTVSGLGSAGASLDQATIVDVFSGGLAVDAGVGAAFQGGPMINQSGQVVAVTSRTYAPLGFTSSGIWYSPYVEAACNKVLSCPNGTLAGAGN